MKIHVLGTGSAGVTQCYNTCFTIENNGEHFLVDAGGGNGILRQLKMAEIGLEDIKNIFVSHTHIDHILGIIWVVRFKIDYMLLGKIDNINVNIYGNEKVIDTLKEMCKLLLSGRHLKQFDKIHFIVVNDNEVKKISGMKVRFFDTLEKQSQYGFDINDNFLVFAGDKPLAKENYNRFENCGWFLHSASNLDNEKEKFGTYKKGHVTVKDAAIIAQTINVKNLIIWHTSDNSLKTRKKDYTVEAKEFFNGDVFVPDDLEVIKVLKEI